MMIFAALCFSELPSGRDGQSRLGAGMVDFLPVARAITTLAAAAA
jgi:hypothetical protein